MHGVSYDRPMISYLTSPFKLPKLIKEWIEVPTLKFCCTKVKDSQVYSSLLNFIHRKNNGFPFLDILGYLKNTHINPKFGKVRQVPIRELGWEFPGWDLSHFAKFGIFMGIL